MHIYKKLGGMQEISMTAPIKERTVRIVLIPQSLYKKLEKQAKKEEASVTGLTCRAIVDFLEKKIPETR